MGGRDADDTVTTTGHRLNWFTKVQIFYANVNLLCKSVSDIKLAKRHKKTQFCELLAGNIGLHTMFTKCNNNCVFVNRDK